MKSLLFILTFSFCIVLSAQTKDEVVIRKMLKQQENAWNEGNLEKFMIGYWQNDSLMFIGKTGPTYGYANTLANYKKGYPDTAHMGKLAFDIVAIKKLSAEYYFVVGKWHLQRSVGNVGGMYTLLFRKINGEWVIVVDHSS